MSIQRAKVNCERCYELAYRYLSEPKAKARFKNNSLYSARNEAMRALEDERDRVRGFRKAGLTDGRMNELCGMEVSLDVALDSCMNCDYSSTKIVDSF
jgi:hypothetical protein